MNKKYGETPGMRDDEFQRNLLPPSGADLTSELFPDLTPEQYARMMQLFVSGMASGIVDSVARYRNLPEEFPPRMVAYFHVENLMKDPLAWKQMHRALMSMINGEAEEETIIEGQRPGTN